jgi:hypothetical protein
MYLREDYRHVSYYHGTKFWIGIRKCTVKFWIGNRYTPCAPYSCYMEQLKQSMPSGVLSSGPAIVSAMGVNWGRKKSSRLVNRSRSARFKFDLRSARFLNEPSSSMT